MYSHNRFQYFTTQTDSIQSDLDISKGQLELFLDQYAETPWKVRTMHLPVLTSHMYYYLFHDNTVIHIFFILFLCTSNLKINKTVYIILIMIKYSKIF